MNSHLTAQQSDRFDNRPMFWMTALIVFVAFFVADHGWDVSKITGFTATADQMESWAAGGNFKRRVAFLSLAGLGLLGLMLPGRQRFSGMTMSFALMAALIGWCMLSILWSDNPSMTIRRCLVLGCLVFAAIGIARQLSLRELLHLAWILPATGLALGFVTELALGTFRPWAGGYRFSGTLHPNTQGLSLAAMCLATFCLARESRWQKQGYLFVFGVGLVFLVLTKSRTSFAGLMLAVTLILTLRTASGLKWSVGLSALWVVTTAAVTVMIFNINVEQELTELALMGRKEQAESLTGRLPIWTALAEYVHQRPIAGYGYESFWTPDRIETVSAEVQWGLREAHNGYVEAVLGLGLIGGILLVLLVFHMLRRAHVQYLQTGHPLYGFLFAMLVFGLVNACTESGIVMPMMVPFLLGCAFLQLAAVESVAGVPNALREPSNPVVPAPAAGC